MLDRAIEPNDLLFTQLIGGLKRMNSRSEKRFIHIDIAKPGNYFLIEQSIFDRARGLVELCPQLFRANGKRLRPDVIFARLLANPPDSAESSRITKSQFKIRKLHDEMSVFYKGSVGSIDRQSSAHAEVDVELIVASQRKNDPLAAAGDLGHRLVLQIGFDIKASGEKKIGAIELNAYNPLTDNRWSERVNDRLNFGKLGHSGISMVKE
ncbi:MAG TPA: hypothetical protein VHD56_09840 [Tepidisphaeraceae bacterium]|nr:hypothetical protein [Tepidisphaeraceae bacterium]